jgi:uncharacterized cupredoxin-like copper-binding protein
MLRRTTLRSVSALAFAVALLGAGAGSAVADAPVHAHAAAAAKTINVTASDYKFKFSATSLSKPGTVTFKITNKGEVQHDLKIDGKTSKMLSPGGSTTLTVKFAKKGKYAYLCTVPGHAALGMKGTFTVK